MKVTIAELKEHLEGQLRHLAREMAAYDAGDRYAAAFLAGTIRTLLRDSKRSEQKSLCTLLGMKDGAFIDGTFPVGGDVNIVPQYPLLVSMGVEENGVPTFQPALRTNTNLREVSFEQWWTAALPSAARLPASRESVVGFIADEAGGAHVDATITGSFHQMRTGEGLPFRVLSEGAFKPLSGLDAACVRQIAEELMLSLMRRSDVCGPPNFDAQRNAMTRSKMSVGVVGLGKATEQQPIES
ncbi:MAG: hypothetical protein ABIO39_13295 [Caulobacteraceae bacterium]